MIRKKILYIGNKVLKRGLTPTTVDTLTPLLNTIYDVKSISDKKNIFTRAINIIFTIIKLRKNIDLIIIDTYSTKNFYVSLIVSFLGRIFKIKYIPYLHGGSLPERLDNNPILSNLIFENSYINVAPSNYIYNAFIKNNYKTTIISNNIDLSNYTFKHRVEILPKLLYVRAFEKTYNPTMAVYVLNELVKNYPDSELCMVGPDKDGTLNEVKDLIKSFGLVNKVKITGKMTKEEWIKLSENYDIFINTTNFDNQPVSVIEAMALGFPVVSTNVGGIPYLIEHNKNGVLVKKNDYDSMTKEIITILKDFNISSTLSVNARKKAEEFDWKNIKKKWKEIIDNVS